MEKTVCPWCHTEIVWDEEFGPEETCPHCNNELSGYRTVSLGRDDLDDELEDDLEDDLEVEEDTQQQANNAEDLWGPTDEDSSVPIINTLEQFRDDYDLRGYEKSTSDILATQEEAPECPQCHELMLLTGTQVVTSFQPVVPSTLGVPLLTAPFSLNLYVCPACFHAQHSLAHVDRIQLIRNLTIQHK